MNWNFLDNDIKRYITVEEYATMFHESVTLSERKYVQGPEEINAVKEKVKKRLGLDEVDKYKLKFDAILVSNCPNRWEECYQIILDHLCTEDGTLTKEK